MVDSPLRRVSAAQRRELAAWVGERPATVLAIHALAAGTGRLWLEEDRGGPRAAMIESTLTPGEPQGFGDADGLLALLEHADGWRCLEVQRSVAASMKKQFARRWGLPREVIDVIHILDQGPPTDIAHPLVRPLKPSDLAALEVTHPDLLPDRGLADAAARAGRLHGAVDGTRIVGQGGSFAAGEHYADVAVAVAPAYRRQGIATAAAARTCRQLAADGLVPVWSTSSDNLASLRAATALGFREVSRLTYLVRGV
jgi:GNAT superfamily N-acetyltransferase